MTADPQIFTVGIFVRALAQGALENLEDGGWSFDTEAVAFLEKLVTVTFGRGVGYRAEEGSFSGWKWVGRNAAADPRLTVRLASSRGTLGPQEEITPEIAQKLRAVAASSLGDAPLEDLQVRKRKEEGRPATAVIGHVVDEHVDRSNGTGAHILFVCVLPCPVSDVFRDIVDSLQRPSSLQIPDKGGAHRPMEKLMEEAGVSLFTGRLKLLDDIGVPEDSEGAKAKTIHDVLEEAGFKVPAQAPVEATPAEDEETPAGTVNE
jgi:hypothetical protein